ARVGGLDLSPSFAGALDTFVGLDQVNVQIPRSLTGRGVVPLELIVDGVVSNQLTVSIK
ncbi:MAG: hypothetical protein EBU88_20395, partial [Acidobacteria bacterium]|nr:hypothetical protein [Acidobacteriota bacterium]